VLREILKSDARQAIFRTWAIHFRFVRRTKARAARSYAALPRAAHYPLSLPPYCKAFMAFLDFCRSASLRSAITLGELDYRPLPVLVAVRQNLTL
jgi:hypothetical protein